MCATERFRRAPLRTAVRAARFLAADLCRDEVTFTTGDGLRFASMPRNFSSFAMCVAGARDPHRWRFISSRLQPGAVFVDAGANIGTYTVPAGRLVGPSGRVIAFEAHPAIMGFLKRNIAANGLANVTALNLALGAERSSVELAFSAHNPGETHIAGRDERAWTVVRVEMTTLDDALRGLSIDAIDYLKVDVEGFEVPVRHAWGIIDRSPASIVQTEVEATHAERYRHGRGDMVSLLEGLGPVPHEVDQQGRATRLRRSIDTMQHGNLVWFRA